MTLPNKKKKTTRNLPPPRAVKKKERKTRELKPIKVTEDYMPLITKGKWRLRWDGTEKTENPGNGNRTVKLSVTVVNCDLKSESLGAEKQILVNVNDEYGRGRLKKLAIGFAGYESDEEARKVDPNDHLTYCILEECDDERFIDALNGTICDVECRDGNPRLDPETKEPTGEYWPIYTVYPEGKFKFKRPDWTGEDTEDEEEDAEEDADDEDEEGEEDADDEEEDEDADEEDEDADEEDDEEDDDEDEDAELPARSKKASKKAANKPGSTKRPKPFAGKPKRK